MKVKTVDVYMSCMKVERDMVCMKVKTADVDMVCMIQRGKHYKYSRIKELVVDQIYIQLKTDTVPVYTWINKRH